MVHRAIFLVLFLITALSYAGELRVDADLSKTDCTSLIQGMLDGFDRHCKLPNGPVRSDSTLFVGADACLELSPRTKLTRGGTSTAPLVQITGNHGTLLGNRGWLITANDSPLGVIHVGPRDPAKLANINWTLIENVVVQGNDKPVSVGLMFRSSELTVGGSNYNGLGSGNVFKFIGTGIDVGPVCNGHTFRDNFFYRQTMYSYRFHGCTEASTFGGFTHHGTQRSVIKLENAGYILFSNVQAEPGSGNFADIDEKCKAICIWGHDNTGKGIVDKGQNTTYFSHGHLSTDKVTTRQK